MRHASCLMLSWTYAKSQQPKFLIDSTWLEKSFSRSGLHVDVRQNGLCCPFMMQCAPKQKLKMWEERNRYRPMYADTCSGVKSLRGDLLILFCSTHLMVLNLTTRTTKGRRRSSRTRPTGRCRIPSVRSAPDIQERRDMSMHSASHFKR